MTPELIEAGDQWVTEDGRVLDVGDMSDDHIYNCVRILNRGIRYRRLWVKRFRLERFKRWLRSIF